MEIKKLEKLGLISTIMMVRACRIIFIIRGSKVEMKKDELLNEFNKINMNSNLNELQKYITKMMEVNHFESTPLELFCYLTEEVGEVAKEIRKTEKNMDMDTKKEYASCLKHEIADVFIYLLAICNVYDIDLLEAFKEKEKINFKRVWK